MRWRPAVLLLLLTTGLGAQVADSTRITHKFAWRRWLDQSYVGFVYGTVVGSWRVTPMAEGGRQIDARYYVTQESRRDNNAFEKSVNSQRAARFQLSAAGTMTSVSGEGVPVYRDYPVALPADAGPGSVWTSAGALSGDFLADGRFTLLPILVEYRYLGEADYFGAPVIQVGAKYALRYRAGQDPTGDPDLSAVEGTRDATVLYDRVSGRPVLLRENAEQTARPTLGAAVRNLGWVTTYFEQVPALGTAVIAQKFRDQLDGRVPPKAPEPPAPPASAPAPAPGPPPAAASASAAAEATPPPPAATPAAPPAGPPPAAPPSPAAGATPAGGPIPGVRVEADPRGVKLTLENLQFEADKAVLLPGESRRLARIAALLKSVPDRSFLVVGHTADLGRPASQDQLSLDRALSVVGWLKQAGVPAGKLLYQGRGGREPLVPNDSEDHKAQNRRVEIIVLDQ